jgi:uncharacterized membrane protein YdbT with pleckstrin-like domain
MLDADPVPAPPAPEESLWRGHTSQWVHFWFYFLCVALAAGIVVLVQFAGELVLVALVVPVAMAVARWLVTKATVFELTSQRLRVRSGILTRRLEELELYRVKDYTLEQPLLLRPFGLGNLLLHTSDATTPEVHIRAVAGAEQLRELLRGAVQAERDRKRVRELDVEKPGLV